MPDNSTLKIMVAAVFLAASSLLNCSNPENSRPAANTATETYHSVGVITSIDRDGGRVTIDHEEIPGYMAAMEMTEPVSDPTSLDGLKVGDKVEFEILRDGSKLTFANLKTIGEDAMVIGRHVYETNCSECHGPKGEGEKKGIPLISGHALNHSEQEYIEQVQNGEGKKMPSFRDKLSAEEIAAVVQFVRNTLQKGVTETERQHHHH